MSDNYQLSCTGTASDKTKVMRVAFSPEIQEADWKKLNADLIRRMDEGYLWWEFDLSTLPLINSSILGYMVAMNGILSSASGRIELLVEEGSSVLKVLNLTKLDQIFRIRTSD